MYAVLTGVFPFPDLMKANSVKKRILKGETSFIDPRYRKRSYAEQQLVEIIQSCWIFKPEMRPDVFEIVKRLRHAIVENARLTNATNIELQLF